MKLESDLEREEEVLSSGQRRVGNRVVLEGDGLEESACTMASD